MTSEDFLHAILKEPEDDFPRLIYADWLEERGDSRGEFIRLQCEMAAFKNPESRWRGSGRQRRFELLDKRELARFDALLGRQITLLLAHREQWLAPFENELNDATFERGFVEEGYTTGDTFLRLAPNWYRQTSLRKLRLDPQNTLNAVLSSQFLLHLVSLELSFRDDSFNDDDAALLAASPNLANLRHLYLNDHQMTTRGIRSLLDSPYLKNLKSLRGLGQVDNRSLQSALKARFGEDDAGDE